MNINTSLNQIKFNDTIYNNTDNTSTLIKNINQTQIKLWIKQLVTFIRFNHVRHNFIKCSKANQV